MALSTSAIGLAPNAIALHPSDLEIKLAELKFLRATRQLDLATHAEFAKPVNDQLKSLRDSLHRLPPKEPRRICTVERGLTRAICCRSVQGPPDTERTERTERTEQRNYGCRLSKDVALAVGIERKW